MPDDWHEIVGKHGPVVWRTVFRLVGEKELARDCYQDTFLAAMRLTTDTPVENWQAMLRTLATRKAIDVLRARARQRSRLNGHTDPQQIPDSRGSGRYGPAAQEGEAETNELIQAVRRVLASVPTRQAEAFALRHLEQMDNQQIADRLGTTPRNVDVLVHRAVTKLQSSLPASVRPDGLPTSGVK